MSKGEQYYSYYEKLRRMDPETSMAETPEYRAIAARYPHLSATIRLRKELERLDREFKSTEERSARSRIRSEMKSIATKLRRQSMLTRIHGEGRWEAKYKRRFVIVTLRRRLSSIAQRIRIIISRFQERSRSGRLSVALKLPPSLLDLKSLDPADRSWALRMWIEKRKVRV